MSLKGVKKAIARTPHQLIGKRIATQDDETMAIWEHDLTTSIAGLTYIQTETNKYHAHFNQLLKKEVELCELIKDEEYDKESEEQGGIKNISHFQHLMSSLVEEVNYKFDEIDSNIGYRCKEMTSYLDNFLKMLKKRNHKKMDVEIHSNNVQKLITKKSTFTDKDMVHLKKEQDLLEFSNKVYFEIDEKIKLIIPEALDMFSEFLSKLILCFQISIHDVYSSIGKALEKFTRNQGMSSTETDDVIKEWQQDFTSPKFTLDSMVLINKYKEKASNSHSSPSSFFSPAGTKLKKEAVAVGNFAQDSTSLLWRKTIHPRTTKINLKSLKLENPVQPKLPTGIFSYAIDPLSHNHEVTQWNSNTPSPAHLSNSSSTPQSPELGSSPWLKPLSLRRQQQQESQDLPIENEFAHDNETKVAMEKNDIVEEPEKLHEETDAITVTDATTLKSDNAIDSLVEEIKRIRTTYSRHSGVSRCPVTIDFNAKHNKEFVNDDALRFQISANTTLSAQLLKSHLGI